MDELSIRVLTMNLSILSIEKRLGGRLTDRLHQDGAQVVVVEQSVSLADGVANSLRIAVCCLICRILAPD